MTWRPHRAFPSLPFSGARLRLVGREWEETLRVGDFKHRRQQDIIFGPKEAAVKKGGNSDPF